jgi:hypothetical protein
MSVLVISSGTLTSASRVTGRIDSTEYQMLERQDEGVGSKTINDVLNETLFKSGGEDSHTRIWLATTDYYQPRISCEAIKPAFGPT